MANPSASVPTSFEYSSLPPLPSDIYMQNVDFSLAGSSSSSLPFFHDLVTQNQQNEPMITQHQQVFQTSYPPPSAQHEYYNDCQMGNADLPAWWPFANDQMANSVGTSTLVEVAPRQHDLGAMSWSEVQQQQEQQCGMIPEMLGRMQGKDDGATISPSSTSSPSAPVPSPFAPWMNLHQNFASALQYSPYTQDFSLFPSLEHTGFRFLLQKELKNSDVSNIGRIVLPKRESEASLPFLSVKEGIQLTILELFTPCVWRMRYRFWPNNKSRMYVLENTGEFIRRHGLKCGDYIGLYQDMSKQLYICSRRVERPLQTPTLPSMLHDPAQEHAQLQALAASVSDEARDERRRMAGVEGEGATSSPANATDVGGIFDVSLESGDHSFHFNDPSASFFDGAGYNMRQLERLPSFEDCDLSIYDVEPERSRDGV